ncbi:MAG TPA: MBL fold metallo-hydrolase [Clostridiaceae bacterium]|nr:MBL fold metallo-hydrolase [Clostridiaceae bacterium]
MRLSKRVSIVGSGNNGLRLTDPLDCNVYIVDCGSGLLMIDTGVGIEPSSIVSQIDEDGYKLTDIKWIVLTHAHADHVGGTHFFSSATGAKVYADPHEASVLGNAQLLRDTMCQYVNAGFYPPGYEMKPVICNYELKNNEKVVFGDLTFTCFIAPGHTGGGLCLYSEIDGYKTLFTGDVVFWNGYINLISIFDVDLLRYKNSIERLSALDVDRLYAGHLQPVMSHANEDIEKAMHKFRNFSVPPSIC